jgi:hypothetical protein
MRLIDKAIKYCNIREYAYEYTFKAQIRAGAKGTGKVLAQGQFETAKEFDEWCSIRLSALFKQGYILHGVWLLLHVKYNGDKIERSYFSHSTQLDVVKNYAEDLNQRLVDNGITHEYYRVYHSSEYKTLC